MSLFGRWLIPASSVSSSKVMTLLAPRRVELGGGASFHLATLKSCGFYLRQIHPDRTERLEA